jgi:glycerate-2-kinase
MIVVGAGKAAASMASEFHRQIVTELPRGGLALQVDGWVNCPQGNPEQPSRAGAIELFVARPSGINVPTPQAVFGTGQILKLVRECEPQDLVICLLSGGGSALLVAPKPGIRLEDKQAVASELAAAGANIEQMNTVRRALSEVKGGGLARACRAGHLVTLIISDVLGDPLETISSGPTLLQSASDAASAWNVLKELHLLEHPRLAAVVRWLQNPPGAPPEGNSVFPPPFTQHIILGNNADAVDAAGVMAVELGYRYAMQVAQAVEGDVGELAVRAAAAVRQISNQSEVDCWISGGEPTVTLPTTGHGRGGRNQQLALSVMEQLQQHGWPERDSHGRPIVFISGGTDGEDGPTDAAGAWFDYELCQRARAAGLEPRDFIQRADAYAFFDQTDGLLRTGPTGTNVCDLRVALAAKP